MLFSKLECLCLIDHEIPKELFAYSTDILNKGLRMKDFLFSKTPLDYFFVNLWNEELLQGQLKNFREKGRKIICSSFVSTIMSVLYIFPKIPEISDQLKGLILDKLENYKELILDSDYEELKRYIMDMENITYHWQRLFPLITEE
jgi:hypothetical protein